MEPTPAVWCRARSGGNAPPTNDPPTGASDSLIPVRRIEAAVQVIPHGSGGTARPCGGTVAIAATRRLSRGDRCWVRPGHRPLVARAHCRPACTRAHRGETGPGDRDPADADQHGPRAG